MWTESARLGPRPNPPKHPNAHTWAESSLHVLRASCSIKVEKEKHAYRKKVTMWTKRHCSDIPSPSSLACFDTNQEKQSKSTINAFVLTASCSSILDSNWTGIRFYFLRLINLFLLLLPHLIDLLRSCDWFLFHSPALFWLISLLCWWMIENPFWWVCYDASFLCWILCYVKSVWKMYCEKSEKSVEWKNCVLLYLEGISEFIEFLKSIRKWNANSNEIQLQLEMINSVRVKLDWNSNKIINENHMWICNLTLWYVIGIACEMWLKTQLKLKTNRC